MSRQYNPAIVAYKNLQLQENKPEVKQEARGLLSPKNIKEDSNRESASDQPMARIAKHVADIRNRRMNKNGD
jgi:hypothetical protein